MFVIKSSKCLRFSVDGISSVMLHLKLALCSRFVRANTANRILPCWDSKRNTASISSYAPINKKFANISRSEN